MKCNSKGIAHDLKDISILRLKRLIEDLMMPRQQARHHIWKLLRQFGAAFYIREEEGDSAGGKRHLRFLQSQRNGLFCCHCTPFYGEMCELCLCQLGADDCQISIH